MKRLAIILLAVVLASLACSSGPSVSAMFTAVAPTNALPTQTSVSLQTAEVTAGSLHVRAEPMGLRIGYLYHADAVTLTGTCKNGWAQIEWNGGLAWVNARFLSRNKCQTSEEQ